MMTQRLSQIKIYDNTIVYDLETEMLFKYVYKNGKIVETELDQSMLSLLTSSQVVVMAAKFEHDAICFVL